MIRIDRPATIAAAPRAKAAPAASAMPATQAVAPRARQPQDASAIDKLKATLPFAGPVLGVAGGSLLGLVLGPVGAVAGALVGGIALGNLGILAFHRLMRAAHPQPEAELRASNPHVVDDKVLRGGKPSPARTYDDLAKAGVTTIVDLRAETNLKVDEAKLKKLGIERVAMPIRDGQIPSEADVNRFLEVVKESRGRVYVHCGAGVGRTGSVASAYLVASGQATPAEALKRSLAVGPPSLEQISFIRGLDPDAYSRPNPLLVGLSRVMDAPRRIWSRLKHVNI